MHSQKMVKKVTDGFKNDQLLVNKESLRHLFFTVDMEQSELHQKAGCFVFNATK